MSEIATKLQDELDGVNVLLSAYRSELMEHPAGHPVEEVIAVYARAASDAIGALEKSVVSLDRRLDLLGL